MKISVIMPVYNGEKYLREAIDSILNQTFTDFEFIIINDCSTDSTEDIIKSYDDSRIVYIKNEKNLGVAGTLNKGLDVAKGEYVARMDADDISLPARFEKQVSFMDKNSNIGVCGSQILIFEDNEPEKIFAFSEKDAALRVDMLFNCAFAHPSVIIRKSILDNHNICYNLEYEKAEDYRMWYDIMRVSKSHNIQEPLLKYRHHQSQVTKTNKTEQTISVTKMRRVMYETLRLNTDDFLDLFALISNGVRTFNAQEYQKIRDFMQLTLIAPNEYNKKLLRKVLSIINYDVKKHSRIDNYKPLSFREYLYMLRGI